MPERTIISFLARLFIIWTVGVFSAFTTAHAATITSTLEWGSWSDPATWEGGVVPGAEDDVMLTGPVHLDANVTVNSVHLIGLPLVNDGVLYFYFDWYTLSLGDNQTFLLENWLLYNAWTVDGLNASIQFVGNTIVLDGVTAPTIRILSGGFTDIIDRTVLNGDMIVDSGWSLTNTNQLGGPCGGAHLETITVHGDIINNGFICGPLWIRLYGDLLNNGTVSSDHVTSYWNLENNWEITSPFYGALLWDSSNTYAFYFSYTPETVTTSNPYVDLTSVINTSFSWYAVSTNGQTYPTRHVNMGSTPLTSSLPVSTHTATYANAFYETCPVPYTPTGCRLSDVNAAKKDQPASKVSDTLKDQNAADPVDLTTGEMTYDNTLFSYPAPGGNLDFSLHYRSRISATSPLGYGWDHSWNQRLSEESDGSITLEDGRLGIHTFRVDPASLTPDGSGATNTGWLYLDGLGARLAYESFNGTFTVTYDDGKRSIFSHYGLPIKTIDAYGNTTRFERTGTGHLTRVVDSLGRNYDLSYDAADQLATITAFDGRSISFTHFTNADGGSGDFTGTDHDLKNITLTHGSGPEDTKVIRFGYDSTSHNLATLSDSKDQVYVRNTFTPNDRVASQTYGSGTVYYTYSLQNVHDENNVVIWDRVTSNEVVNRANTRTLYDYDQRGRPTSIAVYASGVTGGWTGVVNLTTQTYDSVGRLLTVRLPNGNGTKYTYDANGDLTSERKKASMNLADSSSDLLTTYTSDTVKRVITSITHPDGSVESMIYGAGNRLLTHTRKDIRTDPANGGTSTRDETTTYTYDDKGRLATITDPTGRVTSFTYDQYSSLATITRGSWGDATTTTFTNDPTGDTTALQDGEWFTISRTYDAFDRLITEVRPAGGTSQMTYDAGNNLTHLKKTLTSTTEAEASVTYDSLDLPTAATTSYDTSTSGTLQTVYDREHRPVKVTYPDGSSLSTTYDPFSRPKTLTRSPAPTDTVSLPQTTTYTYDGNGNLTEVKDPANRTTTLIYDGFDRVISVTDPLGRTLSLTYDQRSRVLTRSLRDSANVLITKTELTYDEASRPLSRKDFRILSGAIQTAGHREALLTYDEAGRVLTEKDALGRITAHAYDSLGRATLLTDSLGRQTRTTYDRRSLPTRQELLTSTGVTVYQVESTYDSDGRLSQTLRYDAPATTNATGSLTTTTYDLGGRPIRTIEADGGVLDRTYDHRGLVLTETKYLSPTSLTNGVTTTYTYDSMGRLLTVTDPLGRITTMTYDSLGRLIEERLPDTKKTLYTYDVLGRLKTLRDPSGTLVTNTYDSGDRLTSRTVARGTGVTGPTSEIYTYDALDRLLTGNDSLSGAVTRGYDSLHLLSDAAFGGTGATTAQYDTVDRLTNYTTSSGVSFTLTYDDADRLTAVSGGWASMTQTWNTFTKQQRKLGANITTTSAYDGALRLTSLTHKASTTTIGAAHTYAYDRDDDLTQDASLKNAYDALDRLISSTDTLQSQSYTYDLQGNRTKATDTKNQAIIMQVCSPLQTGALAPLGWVTSPLCNAVTTTTSVTNTTVYSWNTLDQYVTSSTTQTWLTLPSTTSATYAYDANGNLKDDGTYLYSYDYRNRLTEVKQKSNTTTVVTYRYDVLGRRTEKTLGTGTTTKKIQYAYWWDMAVQEKDVNASWATTETRTLIYGGDSVDDVVGVIVWSTVKYYLKNHLGSTELITSATGAVLESLVYDNYGTPYTKDTLWNLQVYSGATTRLYTGREYEKETGLYYYRARFYSPKFGRFISRDPVGMADQVNRYAYVENNPLRYVDPMGLEKKLTSSREDRFWELHNYIVRNSDYRDALKVSGSLTPIDMIFSRALQISNGNVTNALQTFWDAVIFSWPWAFLPYDAGEESMFLRRSVLPQYLNDNTEWVDKLQHFAFLAQQGYVTQTLEESDPAFSQNLVETGLVLAWIVNEINLFTGFSTPDLRANNYGLEFGYALALNPNIKPSDILK